MTMTKQEREDLNNKFEVLETTSLINKHLSVYGGKNPGNYAVFLDGMCELSDLKAIVEFLEVEGFT